MKPRDAIASDLYRYIGGTGLRAFCTVWFYTPRFRFLVFLRLSHWARRGGADKRRGMWRMLFWFFRWRLRRYSLRLGVDIKPQTQIGYGLSLGRHHGGVVVHGSARIGDNCNLAHNATIGSIGKGKREGKPRLGNRVWVGPGASIVGGVTIGDDAMIGPGAMVNFDVPRGATVLGNPGRIVARNGSHGYIRRQWERQE